MSRFTASLVGAFLSASMAFGAESTASAETCIASWYGREHQGGPTASGELFNMHAMTAAHRTARLGTALLVTDLSSGRSVRVRVNDRGPYVRGRCIDLSRAAAASLGILSRGTAHVSIKPAP